MPRDSPASPADPSEPEEPDISGVVLAGGASRRMGADKATLRTGAGLTNLEHAARVLAAAGAAPVMIASGTAGRFGDLPWPEVDDGRHRGDGPLAGLLAGLRSSPAPAVAVLAVDLPGADAAVFRWLRAQWRPGDRALVPIDPTGRPQPLHALIATVAAGVLAERLEAGDRRVARFTDAVGARLLRPPPALETSRWWTNRNRPQGGMDPTPGGLGPS